MVTVETYEWAQLWWEKADSSAARVLLIGDSITNSYWGTVNELFSGIAVVDKLATSKGCDNPAFLYEIDYFLKITGLRYKAIHFNNGLHAAHLTAGEYESFMDEAIAHVLALANGAKVILGLSTPVVKPENLKEHTDFNAEVILRNQAVIRLAEKYHLPVNDLYALTDGKPELKSGDGCHFTGEGAALLGRQTAEKIRMYL